MAWTRKPVLGWVVLEGIVLNAHVVQVAPIVGDQTGAYVVTPHVGDAKIIGTLPALPGTFRVCSDPDHALAPSWIEQPGDTRRADAEIDAVFAEWERRMTSGFPASAPASPQATPLPSTKTTAKAPATRDERMASFLVRGGIPH